MPQLEFSLPNLVATFLNSDDRDQNLIMMDITGDLRGKTWRTEMDIIFKPIDITLRSGPCRIDYYLGCTGAKVKMDLLDNGRFQSWTPDEEIDVQRKLRRTSSRGFKFSAKPKGPIEVGGAEYAIDRGANFEEENVVNIKANPRITTKAANAVEWIFKSPREIAAVRKMVRGNQLLSAHIEWEHLNREGKITLRTTDIRIFDENDEALGWAYTIALRYFLRRKMKLQNKDGLTFNFKIVDNGDQA